MISTFRCCEAWNQVPEELPGTALRRPAHTAPRGATSRNLPHQGPYAAAAWQWVPAILMARRDVDARRSQWRGWSRCPGPRRPAFIVAETAPQEGAPTAPLADHLEASRARRADVPRPAAAWSPPADRADPLQILRAGDSSRLPELVPIRYGRMLESLFTFLCGGAAVMAADLATTSASGIAVQACGDAHLAVQRAVRLH